VLDGVLKTLTSPAEGASETPSQEGENSQGSENLVEQLDIEEPEQSKLPQYLERFKVNQAEIESLSAVHKTCSSPMVMDEQPFHPSVMHTKASKIIFLLLKINQWS
jgi:small subunit ribosomal protein S27